MHYGVKKMKVDPIEGVFRHNEESKKKPMHLKVILGIDLMREEVNEVVPFLKNPKNFQDIGSSTSRGVLITGDSGT